MSSAAARAPLPLLAQYSAAKGYIENFTRSLSAEYAGVPPFVWETSPLNAHVTRSFSCPRCLAKGLSFQCQSPLWVATSMTFPGSKVSDAQPSCCLLCGRRALASCNLTTTAATGGCGEARHSHHADRRHVCTLRVRTHRVSSSSPCDARSRRPERAASVMQVRGDGLTILGTRSVHLVPGAIANRPQDLGHHGHAHEGLSQ